MNLQQLMDACPNLTVVSVGDKPAPVNVLTVIRRAEAMIDAREVGPSQLADDLAAARAEVLELVSAARKLRRFVDVSTIRPGKAVAAGWETNCAALDAALANFEETQ